VKRERWWRDEDKYQCLKYFTSHRRNWAVAIILRFICLLNLKLFIYLFVVYLKTLLQILRLQRRMRGLQVSDDLKGTWKEVVMT
jgi:hypothetical protein